MDRLEKLEQECHDMGVDVIQKPFNSSRIKGLYCDGMVALNKGLPNTAEKACTLAEELGHHHTTYGDIIDLKDSSNRKQELRARVWAYRRLLGLDKLINCFRHGCTSVYEAAEYLDVTEEFFLEAIEYYRQHYGLRTVMGNYMISFEPFGILELLGGTEGESCNRNQPDSPAVQRLIPEVRAEFAE